MAFDFQAVKERLSITAVFSSDGHELKRIGRKFRCLSPFNSEKTPSCYIDDDLGRFKCFSSGSSGDIFDYFMLTRGCEIGPAYQELAQRAGIPTSGDWKDAPRPLPRPRPKIEEEKKIEPISGENLSAWSEGVEFLKNAPSTAIQIATWRGISPETVLDLAAHGKIGSVFMDSNLRRQDIEPGARRIAFPVDALIDGEIKQVAYHIRLKPRPGERKASWRFCPSGVGAWPYILGNVEFAKFLVLVEGQWDAIAVFESLGVKYESLWEDKIAIAAMRGAQNWRLFAEHYLLANATPEQIEAMSKPTPRKKKGEDVVLPSNKIRPELKCLVICDADDAGETWSTGVDDQPGFVQILQAVCGRVYVREPIEGFGKDFNDVLKILAPANSQKQKAQNEDQAQPDLRTP